MQRDMTRTATKRLTKSDWLMTGFDAVAETGPDALKAEPLARRLGTTKGSFYWHFADVPAFHAALLAAWEVQATADMLAAVAEETHACGADQTFGSGSGRQAHSPCIDPVDPGLGAEQQYGGRVRGARRCQALGLCADLLSDLDIGNPEMARIIYAASHRHGRSETDRTG